ncbi:helix-turn-helix domain-containing protein [Urbifossiella limnaea]|uniref:Helix-turn-helix domain-containing protein n=1 Tax=Urbifossiella limnaea TaxID=2528023 RepID=A0A517XTB6_9BACT|nr:helix-turn-helix domain-containing protein [Urbifossiella limnaea]QDU20738.1 hypothetical protein ETAA1_26970 [Urbifossiella limnaea]
MTGAIHLTPHAEGHPALTVDQGAAERLSGLSYKTLGRLADQGEPVGRLKVGRRVLFHVPTLAAYLTAKARTNPTT